MLTKLTYLILICLITACNSPSEQQKLSPDDLNGDWILVSVFPDTADLKKAVTDKWPYITINSTKKTIGGYSGCNSFGGEFTLKKDEIAIGDLMANQRGCLGNIEPVLFKHLRSVNRFSVNKDSLKLYTHDTPLLSFVKSAAKRK